MKRAALCLVLAVWFPGCGAGQPADVKTHAIVTVNGTAMLMFTNVYRADTGNQTVAWWTEGVQNSQMTLESCTVRDALNWRCEERGAGAVSGKMMTNGRYEVFGVVQPEGWKFLTDPEWNALQAQQK